MNNVTEWFNVPVERLDHHPDNPRKDLGDLQELTASVKANGVLQNLSIVPAGEDATFYVLIGNRRLEAARAAGLTEVPCVLLTGLTVADQVAIMLEENLQRTDLTIPEQAYGFQQLIDLGESVGTVAEKTGISETTIRHRLKIAELDRDLVEEVYKDRQITIGEFSMLESIEDVQAREKILKESPDSISFAVNSYKRRLKAEQWSEMILTTVGKERKIEPFPEDENHWSQWWDCVASVEHDEEPDLEEFPEGVTLYWFEDYHSIDFFTLDEEKRDEIEKKEAEQAEKNEENQKKRKIVNDIMGGMIDRLRNYLFFLRDQENDGETTEIDAVHTRMMWDIITQYSQYDLLGMITRSLATDRENVGKFSMPLQMMAFCLQQAAGTAVISYDGFQNPSGIVLVKRVYDTFMSVGYKPLSEEENKGDEQAMLILVGKHEIFGGMEE